MNNKKLAEYELKLIFVITHGAKYPKEPVYRISGSWKRLTCCIYGCFENDDLRVEWDDKVAQVRKPHTNLFLPNANP